MAASKQMLRNEMRSRRSALSPADIQARSAAACAALLESLTATGGILEKPTIPPLIALYAAMQDELDPIELDTALRARGVVVAYPRTMPGSRTLRFYRVPDPRDLIAGTWKLREPALSLPQVPITAISAFVVPGLAFDRNGNRVGWGHGYYDTTLAAHPGALRVGLAFDCQIVPKVPTEAHDLAMGWLTTEYGTITPQEPA